jgi:hypothetical protein
MPSDTERFAWLASNEYDLVTHHESHGDDEYTIWWNVTKAGNRSVSGHPLGSPQAAIDAAMAIQETKRSKA